MRLLALAAALLAFCASFASAQTAAKPNVLFISIDDLRTEVGAFGSKRAKTPQMDRLAARGVKFTRAYCQYPLCNPSRVSLLTGRYPTTSGIYGNRDWFGAWYPDWVSLPKYFKQNGYVTVRSGKIFHGDLIDDGEAWTIGGVMTKFTDQKRPERFVSDRPTKQEEEHQFQKQIAEADRRQAPTSDRWEAVADPAEIAKLEDNRVTERAIQYLRDRKPGDAPFFLGFGLVKPHSPLVAPKQFFDLYPRESIELPIDFAPRPTLPEGFPPASLRMRNADLFIGRDASPDEAKDYIRAYLACTSFADWNVGRILDALKETGHDANTIVVLWSDHGYQLGEKGKWSKAGSLWEQGARVPLIIYDPRAKGNGQECRRVVELLDLYPTLVELAGLPPVKELEGKSLSPLLQNPNTSWDRVAYTVWNERGRGVTGVVVRTERWRYAEFFGPGAGAFLTDPENDPHELENLVNDPKYAAVVKELAAFARAKVANRTEPQ
jgi:iduronate 2-sulfatase